MLNSTKIKNFRYSKISEIYTTSKKNPEKKVISEWWNI